MTNLLTAIEQANKLAQSFGLQFFAYVSDGEQKENLSSNLVLSNLETVVGGLREWRTGPIPEPKTYCIVFMEFKDQSVVPAQEIVSWYCEDQSCWKWNEFKPLTDLREGKIHHLYTGRWFIQPINLPKK